MSLKQGTGEPTAAADQPVRRRVRAGALPDTGPQSHLQLDPMLLPVGRTQQAANDGRITPLDRARSAVSSFFSRCAGGLA